MIISLWIIIIVIVTAGFWFYYQKHKQNIKSIPKNNAILESKYRLSDIDKMLEHVTKKEKRIQEESDPIPIEEPPKAGDDTIKNKSKQNKTLFDPENSIISSIILKKKDL